jgi:hypothetical protein
MIVLIFVTLLLMLLAVAWRQLGSALRIATADAARSELDAGSIQALARALHLLETGLPPANPYVCCAAISTPGGSKTYTVTFAQGEDGNWSIHAEVSQPGDATPPMPDTFAASPA